MKTVDAQPVFVHGDYAVWDVVDIPVGVRRHLMAQRAVDALRQDRLVCSYLSQAEHVQRGGYFAAVLWRDLQPAQPAPRGRTSMTAEQWGHARGPDGVCAICRADDSMWCDKVVHGVRRDMAERIQHERLASAYKSTLINGAVPPPAILPPPTPFPSRGRYHALEAAWGELIDRRDVSPEAREEWARELRQRVSASTAEAAERERLRVLVDIQDME